MANLQKDQVRKQLILITLKFVVIFEQNKIK